MQLLHPADAARAAPAAAPARPATSVLFDSPDARLLTFRIAPGQHVAAHRNAATVLLLVLAGAGLVEGPDGERACRAGDLVAFAPHEVHGMRAEAEELLLLAILAPRPGERAAATTAGTPA
jgi:quercetin dioxygenase-like cupin family protein